MRLSSLSATVFATTLAAGACRDKDEDAPRETPVGARSAPAPSVIEPPASTSSVEPTAPTQPGVTPLRPLNAPLHATTREELLSLVDVTAKKSSRMDPARFLEKVVSPDGPGRLNQGNPAIAEHTISRAACIEGLRGVVLQNPQQRETCGGRDHMVPIYKGGDPSKSRTCIDVFEYPNKPCELPVVWVPPTHAEALCELAGKRLCTQDEWVLACAGDPMGGGRQKFAYGDALDFTACNTNKSSKSTGCDAKSVKSAWKTCPTRTEPSGAFPRCRSRFGVFDLHGNVAEAMTRIDEDGTRVSQLKGSAWFYVDVARRPWDKPTKENYPDHCAHDPRWHVEPMRDAMHSNYHLGFRCCVTIGKER